MSADFTPSQSSIKDLKPFRFWCQKVLPTVYDDSLSYYELLNKVVNYINDTIDNVELLNQNVENIFNAYELLQDWVNNYFDNTDFQQMVDDKLDEMASDGTLTALIRAYIDPYFDAKSAEIDAAISEQNDTLDSAISNQNTQINVLQSQMAEFIADHAGPALAFTLWSGYADAEEMTIELSDNPSNYDYIEVYFRTNGSAYCPTITRFPASNFHSSPSVAVVKTEVGETNMDKRLHEYRIRIEPTDSVDEKLYKISHSNHWIWDGESANGVTNYTNTSHDTSEMSAGIVKIVGIKNVQNDTEVNDLRVGFSGARYATAGEAVRSEMRYLNDLILDTTDSFYKTHLMSVNTTVNGWRLLENGLCVADSGYKFVKYVVQAGLKIKVYCDYLFQFQNAASVPSSGTPARVGPTYTQGTYILTVPEGATYLILCSPVNGTNVSASVITDYSEAFVENLIKPIFYNGTVNNHVPDYSVTANSKQWLITDEIMSVKAGSYIECTGTTMYIIVESYDNTGNWLSRLYAGNLSQRYVFASDANVRIVCRNTDYAFIVPTSVTNNYKFVLINKKDLPVKKAKITFIGLGVGNEYPSGQSQLIQLPNGKNLLIDSHIMTSYTSFYYKLRNAGVRHIDYYVQTHYHSDHCGLINLMTQSTMTNNIDINGMVAFLPQQITVENLASITGDTPQTLVDRQNQLISILNDNNCTIVRPSDDYVEVLDDDISLHFYNSDHTQYADPNSTYYSHNYNDWSLCCYLNFGDNCVNFSSDIGPIAQRKLGGTLPKATILTAPHHGWDNGVNNLIPAFINNVNPDVVISVNGWEHNPANENSAANMLLATSPMQSYCEANGVPNYPTCINGPITISMDLFNWKFLGIYSRYIRNGKNWKYSDNTDKQE